MSIINSIVSLGTSVMMPIIFFILALCFGVKIGKAFKAALMIGIGFEGLGLVIDLLLDNLGPAANQMIENLGVSLNVLDTGWPVAATVGWGSPIMVWGVVIFIIINILMIVFKLTNTVDIDIFNYWIFLCSGAIIYAMTGNFILALLIIGVLFALMLKVGDWTAEKIGKEFDMEGISFPHLNTAPWVLLGIGVNYIFEKIPFLSRIELNPDKLNKRIGVFGEPLTLGFILGGIIGVLARYDWGETLTLAIKVSTAMVLLPRMVGILMEGLMIVRDAVEDKLRKIFPERKFYIGMDVALLVGDPSVMAVGLLLIPITLLLAIILPGNKILPFVDLASLIFVVTMLAAYCKKDMLRMLIAGTIMVIFVLYAATDLSELYTQATIMSNVNIPEGISQISCLNGGFATPLTWIIIKAVQLFYGLF